MTIPSDCAHPKTQTFTPVARVTSLVFSRSREDSSEVAGEEWPVSLEARLQK